MNHSIRCLSVGASSLWAVPALHYRLAFAEEVNRLCFDPATRPEAIAVELGHELVAEVATWLRELGIGTTRQAGLPCMLGLQQADVSLPPKTEGVAGGTTEDGRRRLPTVWTLFLSPTDSIIEAIVCALELNVPLYGVDLDEKTEGQRTEPLLQDPTMASGRVDRYVEQNALYAGQGRDPLLDSGREAVMAASLKSILARHRRVLFTGGLGHWLRLQSQLLDPRIPAGPIPVTGAVRQAEWKRVLVHPRLAIRYMDAFPKVTREYQNNRRAICPMSGLGGVAVNPSRLFEELLQTVYREHFYHDDPEDQLNRRLEDWEARGDFEQLLLNLCLLKQILVPDLFTILAVAQGMMSPAFCERLANVLMRFEWARPGDFPGLPVIHHLSDGPGERPRMVWIGPNGRPGGFPEALTEGPDFSNGSVLFGGTDEPWPVKLSWEWDNALPPEPLPAGDMVLSWPPSNYLLDAMSLRAMDVARTIKDDRRVEAFEGSLHDGLDMKATLRSHAGGEDRFYVRAGRYRRPSKAPPEREWEPIVWIFRLGRGPSDRLVVMGEDLNEFVPHVANPDRLRRVQRELGTVGVEQVGFGMRIIAGQPDSPSLVKGGDHCLDWRGMLCYSPSHFRIIAQARRMEDTDYQRNPFCAYRPYTWSTQHLVARHPVNQMFQHRHQVTLNLEDWPATLVRMAIPYARAAVIVVAPDQFQLPQIVFAEASRRQVEIRVVPQSYFPREVLRNLTRWHAVQPIPGTNGERFPEVLTRIFGEEPTANRHLLPPFWWNYGQRTT